MKKIYQDKYLCSEHTQARRIFNYKKNLEIFQILFLYLFLYLFFFVFLDEVVEYLVRREIPFIWIFKISIHYELQYIGNW